MHIRNAAHIPAAERRLFLNIDPRIPEHPSRFEQVLRDLGDELRQAGISPADVVCEITEAETQNKAALTHFAYELRARGYMIAVDDFGARASQPDRVAAIAPDIVKFDGGLVRRLLETQSGAATLRLMVSQFDREGIHSVLEGVEALWELGACETTGADMVQGFALAAPRLAGPQFGAWLAQYRPQPETPAATLVKSFR
jgi:EAL domain-containing protein (putative c-di-GMP-specific phosphodiesterase class I)